jgi:DNA-directed RNA polymerase specialized sigma subunit, sigma24 homolog
MPDLTTAVINRTLILADESTRPEFANGFCDIAMPIAQSLVAGIPDLRDQVGDLGQEAFIRLWRQAPVLRPFRDRSHFRAFLTKILRHLYVDTLKARFRGAPAKGQTGDSELDDLASSAAAPDIIVAADEEFRRNLKQCGGEELQQIAFLRCQGDSKEQIARALDCTEREIKEKFAQIRRRLQQQHPELETERGRPPGSDLPEGPRERPGVTTYLNGHHGRECRD